MIWPLRRRRRKDRRKGDRRAGPRIRIAELLPPEGVPVRFAVASLGARFGAQIVDVLLTAVAIGLLVWFLAASGLVGPEAIFALAALLFFAMRVPYYVATELMWNGQTIGKRLMGLRVISGDGRSLSAHAVTLRNLMKEMEVFVPGTYLFASAFLSWEMRLALVIWIAILILVPMRSPRNRRFGDILANTLVVELPKAVLLPDLARQAAAGTTKAASSRFLPNQLDHYGRYELQTLESLLQVRPEKLDSRALANHKATVIKVAATIAKRIEYTDPIPDAEARTFLAEFYAAQRAHLESRRLFGDAREDKFHREKNGVS